MQPPALDAARARLLADRAVVLGNGPSLQAVKLHELTDITTIGMNAAYRYWDRIDWYPTHYCCLDEELVATHRERIRQLVLEGLVETAFVTARLLEFYPELKADDRFFFIDSLFVDSPRPHPWRDRGRALGLHAVAHPVFGTGAPDKVTTGAYAVRYAMFLGFRDVYLAGIDCRYTEGLDEAESAGDTAGGNLHLQALEAVRDDIVRNGLAVEVFNSSPESLLSESGVFPFWQLAKAREARMLSAVAVPLTSFEEPALVENLARWNEPGLVPRFPSDAAPTTALVVVLNGKRQPAFEDRIRAIFDGLEHVAASFSSLDFQYCELDASEDYYERDYTQSVGPAGYKAGPNAQFFRTMELLRPYGGYAFQMETDCYPVRPGWLTELERVVAAQDPFWVMGSIYRGVGTLDREYRHHINGNAVYAVGDDEFHTFLSEVWRPVLRAAVEARPVMAYDCVLPVHFAEDGHGWNQHQRHAHRFRYTDYIQNHAGRAELERGEGKDLRSIRAASPQTYVVHGRHLRPGATSGDAPRRQEVIAPAG